MLYKDPGNTKIHCLQVIHLYEANLNFLMGVKWKEGLHHAEKQNTLHPGQYGSHLGRDPKTVTLLKELCLDYLMLVRQPFVNIDNDANSLML